MIIEKKNASLIKILPDINSCACFHFRQLLMVMYPSFSQKYAMGRMGPQVNSRHQEPPSMPKYIEFDTVILPTEAVFIQYVCITLGFPLRLCMIY